MIIKFMITILNKISLKKCQSNKNVVSRFLFNKARVFLNILVFSKQKILKFNKTKIIIFKKRLVIIVYKDFLIRDIKFYRLLSYNNSCKIKKMTN